MADFPCPKGDYTASKASEAEAALDLVDHLLKAHCRTNEGPVIDSGEYVQLSDLLSELAVKVRLNTSVGGVDIKKNIDVGRGR